LSNSCCFSTKSTIVTGCCCWWLLRAERTCCLSFVEIVDEDEDESSCESHADCQRALCGLAKKNPIEKDLFKQKQKSILLTKQMTYF
jgi:hypothetical protein